MDRKTIIVLVISFGLLLVWTWLPNKLFPPKPLPPRTNAVAQATNLLESPSTNVVVPPPAAAGNVLPGPRPSTLVPTGTPEQVEVVETAESRYTFTSHGGGLKLVELKRYPESVSCRGQHSTGPHNLASLNTAAPLPALTLLGGDALQGDGVFQLTRTANGLRAEKTLSNGLHLVKEFETGSNYLVTVTARLENRSAQPLALPVQEWVIGTSTPMGLLDDATRLAVYWYNGTKRGQITLSDFSSTTFGCIPRTPPSQVTGGSSDVVWASVQNQFFALAVIPSSNAPATQIVVVKTNLPPPSAQELKEFSNANKNPAGLLTSLTYPALTLSPTQSVVQQFYVYAGPKEFGTLARITTQFGQNLDEEIMDYRGFFGFFAKVLLLSMNGLHHLFSLPYGLAIIVITVIIKLVFWPLTQASTRSMKRMQAFQPQMKAIQERFKDDPAKMNRKMMEFMKEHKVSPLGGCLPMLLQIPVFFGFYRMIQSAIELRGAQFLWACDLSKPDTIFQIPGTGWNINPLPLLMGATMLWQARLTPASPGMDPAQQKIMKYMPLMFLVFLYNFSAGLTLYWTVQNLLTIAQMKLTRAKDQTPAAPAKAPVPAAAPKKKK
jgi:YidC/Oxa1 family membrane protein insertase